MAAIVDVSWIQFEVPGHADGVPVDPQDPFFGRRPCDCDCECCGAPPAGPHAPGACAHPVRYSTGEVILEQADLTAGGFGASWGHTRSFASRLTSDVEIGNGWNWIVKEWPYLVFQDDAVVVMSEATAVLCFDKVDSSYVPRFSVRDTLLLDSDNGVFRLIDLQGGVREFSSATGAFQRSADAAGNTVDVVSHLGNGFNFTEVQRSVTISGITTIESYLYSWIDDTANFPLLSNVTLRRKVDAGSWINVNRASYSYYGDSESYGSPSDLKTITTATWNGAAWTDTGTTYCRYLVDGESPPEGGHLVRQLVLPNSYDRIVAASLDPLTISTAALAPYADNSFDYDEDRRVIEEAVNGGTTTHSFAFEASDNDDGYNIWKTKTTETATDGSQRIAYTNFAGQTILYVIKNGDETWCDFYKYGDDAKLILHAKPSAVLGFNDAYPDLLHEVSGVYEYLRDNDGFIETFTYQSPSGYLASEQVQKGQLGNSIKRREFEYLAYSAGPAPVDFLSREIVYPSDTDDTKQIVTSYTYDFFPSTCAIRQRVTRLPIITGDQNGSGVASLRTDIYDIHGNLVWHRDERGFLTRTTFDIPTGAVVQRIDDVDTTLVDDAPLGWATLSGGGLHLITDFEFDDEGRQTQTLGPSHEIDLDGTATIVRRASWTVFKDPEHEVWTGRGYATGTDPSYTYTLINPVSISKSDADGKPLEMIQAVRESTSGKLDPSDTFAQSSYTRWTTMHYGDNDLISSQRVYHTIPTSGPGESGANYDESQIGYDLMQRQNRQVTPGGTISRTVFDVRGNPISIWMGTDDEGATDADPAGGGAGCNNMVVITENLFDAGIAGGDSNLTQLTQHVDYKTTRVTVLLYDWRNRCAATDGEIDFYQTDTYDNRDLLIKSERYDTTAMGNLVSRNESFFDDRGRAYRTARFGVDPATGHAGNGLVDNTWFDAAGNVCKSQSAGSELFTKHVFDGVGRLIASFLAFDRNEIFYPAPGDVRNATVLEQTETRYDDGSNAIESIARMRYHNATGTGPLGDPSSPQPKARVTFRAMWPDALGRLIASADYGTNGGDSLVRPDEVPDNSDSCLVTIFTYTAAGDQESMTDPSGMVSRMDYDDAGRETSKILNDSGSSPTSLCIASADIDVAVLTSYTPDGNIATITAVNSATGNQVTRYAYGTKLPDSAVATSNLKRAEFYPDSEDDSDRIAFTYNRQGEIVKAIDQNGTAHVFEYDLLGRRIEDRITTLAPGIDGAVRRIGTSYEVRGMIASVTSYDRASAGTIVNQVRMAYNSFGQLVAEYQSHDGPVNMNVTPSIGYGYADGSSNTIRATTVKYPSGRMKYLNYGPSGSVDDMASRVAAIGDQDAAEIVQYAYLGGSFFVETKYVEPGIQSTLIGSESGDDPDTGEIYRGLDRFGRIKDLMWQRTHARGILPAAQLDYRFSNLRDLNNPGLYVDLASAPVVFESEDVERIQYTYNRVGNRTSRRNTVDPTRSHDELYSYDGIHRLKDVQRGRIEVSEVEDLTFAQCWTLDATGNWSGFREDDTGDGTWNLVQFRTSNPANEITLITNTAGPAWTTPIYDREGNTLQSPLTRNPDQFSEHTYDAWNRVTHYATSSTTAVGYRYDGLGRRIGKSGTADDQPLNRAYYWTIAWQLLEEHVSNGSADVLTYLTGQKAEDDVVFRDSADGRIYRISDASQSTVAILSNEGIVIERYSYSPYGHCQVCDPSFAPRETSIVDWQRLYCGYQYDLESGLYYVRNRYYHDGMGRFLTRDPLCYVGGVNLYQYVSSDPILLVDPNGLFQGVPEAATAVALTGTAATVGTVVVVLGLVIVGVLAEELIRHSVKSWRCRRSLERCLARARRRASECKTQRQPGVLPGTAINPTSCEQSNLTAMQQECFAATALCFTTWFGGFAQPPLNCRRCDQCCVHHRTPCLPRGSPWSICAYRCSHAGNFSVFMYWPDAWPCPREDQLTGIVQRPWGQGGPMDFPRVDPGPMPPNLMGAEECPLGMGGGVPGV